MKKFSLLCFSLAAVSAAMAQPAAVAPANGAEVSFAVTVSRQIANDEAVMQFSLTRSGPTASAAQKKLIGDMNRGLAALKAAAAPDTEFQTGSVYTHPEYSQEKNEQRKIVSWVSRGSLSVRAKGSDEASKIMAAAGEYLEFSGIQFQVSRAQAGQVRTELIREAFAGIGERANAVASSMGIPAESVRVKKVTLDENGYQPVAPRRMMLAASASNAKAAPAPDLEAGKSNVDLTASAVLVVKTKD